MVLFPVLAALFEKVSNANKQLADPMEKAKIDNKLKIVEAKRLNDEKLDGERRKARQGDSMRPTTALFSSSMVFFL